MRKIISRLSKENTKGRGAKDHHSGVTNVLMLSELALKLA